MLLISKPILRKAWNLSSKFKKWFLQQNFKKSSQKAAEYEAYHNQHQGVSFSSQVLSTSAPTTTGATNVPPPKIGLGHVIGWGLAGFLIGALAGPLVLLLVYLVLMLLGFTVGGVLALSCAACCQSRYYGGETGGCFSCAQSIGAAGFSKLTIIASSLIGAAVGAGIAVAIIIWLSHQYISFFCSYRKYS